MNIHEVALRVKSVRCQRYDAILACVLTFSNVVLQENESRGQPARRNPIAVLQGHTQPVTGLAISPDGMLIASGGFGNTIILWALGSKREARRLKGHKQFIDSLEFSPDGKRLAAGCGDGLIIVWDVESGRKEIVLEGHDGAVFDLVFTNDGKHVISCGQDGSLRLWDSRSGKQLRHVEGHSDWVSCISSKRKGESLAAGSSDDTVSLWGPEWTRIRTLVLGSETPDRKNRNHVLGMAWGPKERSLYVVWANEIQIWDAANGRRNKTIKTGNVFHYGVCFVLEKNVIVTASDTEGTIKVWDLATGKCIAKLLGHSKPAQELSVNPDGTWIASGSWDSTVRVWKLPSKEVSK